MKPNAAFLLSQVGAHAAGTFATLLAPLDITPPHFGIVWMLSRSPGISQREMAARLEVHPSRLVALLDHLETRRLLERRGHTQDRRLHALHLTAQGQELLRDITRIAEQHLKLICAALTVKECDQLAGFLQRIADQQKLTPAVHPGYRWLGRKIGPRSM
jgi:DNA-binding MarR family transcriptional regulator